MSERYLDQQVFRAYGEINAERLAGTRQEKESSIAAARRLSSAIRPGGSVLDVGCSAGHFSRTLLNVYGRDIRYTGVDIDAYALNLGREITRDFGARGLKSYDFIEAPADKLPFDDKQFDVLVSMNLLEHLKNPIPTLHEFVRVTKGFILLRTLVWSHTYIIMESRVGHEWKELEERDHSVPLSGLELRDDGSLVTMVYHNLWGQDLLFRNLVGEKLSNKVQFELDLDFDPDRLNRDTIDSGLPNATRVIDGRQIEGPLIPPHTWIAVEIAR